MLAKEAGFRKIGEKIVEHRARKYGVTKYGLDRFVKGYLDLLTIGFITRFRKKSDASFRITWNTYVFDWLYQWPVTWVSESWYLSHII